MQMRENDGHNQYLMLSMKLNIFQGTWTWYTYLQKKTNIYNINCSLGIKWLQSHYKQIKKLKFSVGWVLNPGYKI